jgi:Leucine-rich repeat (LRR) protein
MPPSKMNQKEQKAYDEAVRRIAHYKRMGGTAPPLSLLGMGLTALPPQIGDLTDLTELRLGNNQLTTLPREIGQLTALTQLWLQDNQLTTLPPEIGQLQALTVLSLMDNGLATLPGSLRDLPKRDGLFLHGNPGPRFLRGCGDDAAPRYARARWSDASGAIVPVDLHFPTTTHRCPMARSPRSFRCSTLTM